MGPISIVCAARDRSGALHASLPSWIAMPSVAEIVLVDWASRPSLLGLGILDVPKLVLVSLEEAGGFAPGLARNIGVQVARSAIVLALDADMSCAGEAALGRGFARALAGEGFCSAMSAGGQTRGQAGGQTGGGVGLPMPGAMLFGRDAFERVGGYHEWLAGETFGGEDLANRLEDGGTPHLFLSAGGLVRTPRMEAARPPVPHDPEAEAVPGGLERMGVFEAQRNRILAGLAPWHASLAALRPRRLGRVAPNHHSCVLAPASAFERRQSDCARVLAARLLGAAQGGQDAIDAPTLALLEGLFDERGEAWAERAARVAQIDALRLAQIDALAGAAQGDARPEGRAAGSEEAGLESVAGAGRGAGQDGGRVARGKAAGGVARGKASRRGRA